MIIGKKTFENILIVLLISVIFISAGRSAFPVSGNIGKESYDVPVIMYHAIMQDASRSGKYVITPDTLRKDIEYILSEGYTPVFITDLINFADSGTPLPEKPIVLTFDDGYYNNYLYAFPLTKEYNIKAVISIIGKETQTQSEDNEKQSAAYSHVSWEQLKEMTGSGLWEVGNHTYNMHTTGKKNGLLAVVGKTQDEKNDTITDDIQRLQELILTHTGTAPSTFTYPFGSYDENILGLIDGMNFGATLSCIEGINKVYKGCDMKLLYRYNRPSGKDSEDFFVGILK